MKLNKTSNFCKSNKLLECRSNNAIIILCKKRCKPYLLYNLEIVSNSNLLLPSVKVLIIFNGFCVIVELYRYEVLNDDCNIRKLLYRIIFTISIIER